MKPIMFLSIFCLLLILMLSGCVINQMSMMEYVKHFPHYLWYWALAIFVCLWLYVLVWPRLEAVGFKYYQYVKTLPLVLAS